MVVSIHQVTHVSTIFLLICYCRPIGSQQQNISQPEVTILQGTLQGTTLITRRNRNIHTFLAIPYAQPPIGNLRFANPVAADGWTGIRDATVDGNMCSQIRDTILGAEDCLNINVYTPKLPENTSSTLLPVMVWIYGGGFVHGSHSSDLVGPGHLLDADVVLAAPNYRLGPFGFLSTGDEVASGNWGLKDQILALQWVQNNIKYFGGDPSQVTLFGQSAGAGSVHLLTLSDATDGLFHRYITQSGSALGLWAYYPRASYANRAFELGEYVGCSNITSASLISCLRGINVSDILASSSHFTVWESLPPLVWCPTDEPDIDGAVLRDSPTNIFATGSTRDLPWMGGVVRDEGLTLTKGFYTDEELFVEFLEKLDALLPELLFLEYQSDYGTAWVKAIKSYFFNNDLTTNTSELLTNLTVVVGDVYFLYPLHKAMEQQLALGMKNPQYLYTFNYLSNLNSSSESTASPIDYLIGHGSDRMYLFPDSSKYPSSEMIDTMVELWTSFAINGTPTTTSNDNTVTWEPFSTDDNYLRIGNDSDLSLEVQYSFFKERMQFWAALETAVTSSGAFTTHPNLFIAILLSSLKFILSLGI